MLRFEFLQNLPVETPSRLKIFGLEKARADQSIFINLLSRLGLMGAFSGFRWKNDGGWTTAESKDARVSINQRSGALRFWTRLNDRELPRTPFSIDEPRLAPIARNFLKRTGLAPIPVEQLKVIKIAYLHMQTKPVTGKATSPRILDAGVIFGRELEGVPVSGPGGYVMINVGPDESGPGRNEGVAAVGQTPRHGQCLKAGLRHQGTKSETSSTENRPACKSAKSRVLLLRKR